MQRPGPESAPGAATPAPGEASPPRSFPAGLSVLYRSAFSQDCEAIARQLRREDARTPLPRPRCASTIDAETLPPLGPSWSFLGEAFRTPARDPRSPEQEGGAGGDGHVGQAPAAAGPPPAAAPPSGPASPPPHACNRTYVCGGGGDASASGFPSRAASWADSRATYLCDEGSRRLSADAHGGGPGSFSLAGAGGDASTCLRCTFEWELPAAPGAGEDGPAPLVTSTPRLSTPPAEAERATPSAKGSASRLTASQRLPGSAQGSASQAGRLRPGSGGRVRRGSTPGTASLRRKLAAATSKSNALSRKGLPPGKKSLSSEFASAKRSLRAPSAALPLPGKGKILQGAGADSPGARLRSSALPGTSSGAGQSQTLTEKQLPGEMKKTQTKLPFYKKQAVSIQPPSKLARRPAVGSSVMCLSMEQQRVCGEKKAPGTRLPVHRGLTEKPASGALLAAGQIPRAAPGRGSAVSCLECSRLLEENQRLLKENTQLKTMLDKYQHKGVLLG